MARPSRHLRPLALRSHLPFPPSTAQVQRISNPPPPPLPSPRPSPPYILHTPSLELLRSPSKTLNPPTTRIGPPPNELRCRLHHDGRPRGPLWRGRKLIGKEALFVIQGLKRFKNDEERLGKFISSHLSRLLKVDMIAVLCELERQEEVDLSIKVFAVIQKEIWYKPDVYLYKDLIITLAKSKKMEEAMRIWDLMKKENLFPDSQTYAEVIRGFLRYGSPADAMSIYEDMKKSPDPPGELPFRILLKGLIPHVLLRNKVKQDFEELFPQRHIYDPPEEIFGMQKPF